MQFSRICAKVTELRLRAATIALLVLVLGNLSAWAHDGAVRHVRCATHGELVDAPEMSRAPAEGVWFVGVEASTSDDHCSLANGIHVAPSRAIAAFHTTRPTLPIAILQVTPRLAAAIDYRIAPKTSPPIC